MIGKAAGAGADLAFLDLEDAVAPSQKAAARRNVIDGFSTHDWGSTVRCFRMNGVHTAWAVDDLTEVVGAAGNHVDAVMVPKVRSPRDIWFVETLLSHLERKHGLQRSIGIEVLIEEAEALANVESRSFWDSVIYPPASGCAPDAWTIPATSGITPEPG
jgi:citrate lyase subunit beta/citryl-CoA lyase